MRSRLLLLGKPNNKAYAFRSVPRAIKSGCTRKKYEELTESLIRANPKSAGVFEISHRETNAHSLIGIKNTPFSPLHSQKANPTITYCSYMYANACLYLYRAVVLATDLCFKSRMIQTHTVYIICNLIIVR
jgi:hypothetical protein